MDILHLTDIVRETDSIFFSDSLRGDVRKKGDCDFVTRADTEISAYLHKRLADEFLDIGFMSEEEEHSCQQKRYWILDPIDGTTNFMYSLGLSAVSLGLCENGEITCGVIYLPHSNEMFYAQKGQGAYLNGKKIVCNKKTELSECLTAMELNAYFKTPCDETLRQVQSIYTKCRDIRCFGCAAVSLAYIACGRLDLFLGRFLKPWDYAAGQIIVAEAGGVLAPLEGKADISRLNTHIVSACDPSLLDNFKDIL